MSLYDYLLNAFGYNEPFLTSEIKYENYSKPWLYKELTALCKTQNIIRYEKGMYYIPTKTILGLSSLEPYKAIKKKYLFNGKERIGYFSGIGFLNQMGLSTQMPNTLEIYTNNEPSQVRSVKVGYQKVILRKARTPINNANADVLNFLELMNFVPANFFDDEKKAIVSNFIKEKKITKKDITKYAPIYPDKALRTLIESELIYDVTQ